MITWLQYVRYADVPAFEAAGWVHCADLGPVHGAWSVLMRWAGRGKPTSFGGAI